MSANLLKKNENTLFHRAFFALKHKKKLPTLRLTTLLCLKLELDYQLSELSIM